MSKIPPICIYTLDRVHNDDRDSIVRGLLQARVELTEVKILLKWQQTKQPVQNTIRYLIGRFLNTAFQVIGDQKDHFAWAKENLDLEEYQDRRLRRHASNIDNRVAEGNDILDVLKLPALTLLGTKSRKDRKVEKNLDALRSLRGDLRGKIVTKQDKTK